MTEFLSCRPNLEVDDLAPAAAFLRDLLGFEVEVDEPGMGLMLLRRDAVGLALVRSATPGVNATTTAYIGVAGVDDLHEQCTTRGARIVTGLTDHPWGLRDFVVEVPGGHRLALGERIAQPRLSRPQAEADRPAQSPFPPGSADPGGLCECIACQIGPICMPWLSIAEGPASAHIGGSGAFSCSTPRRNVIARTLRFMAGP